MSSRSEARCPRYSAQKDERGYWTVFAGDEPRAVCRTEGAADLLAAAFNADNAGVRDADVR